MSSSFNEVEREIAASLQSVPVTSMVKGLQFMRLAIKVATDPRRADESVPIPEVFSGGGEFALKKPHQLMVPMRLQGLLAGNLNRLTNGKQPSQASLIRIDLLRYLLENASGLRLDFIGEKRVAIHNSADYYKKQLALYEQASVSQQKTQTERERQIAQQNQQQQQQMQQQAHPSQWQQELERQRQMIDRQRRMMIEQQQMATSHDENRMGWLEELFADHKETLMDSKKRPHILAVRSDPGDAPTLVEAPPDGSIEEQRYLVGRMADHVQTGQTVPVTVRLSLQAGGGVSAPTRPLRVFPQGTDVSLDVYCPGFKSKDAITQKVRVFPGQDSDWVRFEIQALKEGNFQVEVTAYAHAAFLGTITLPVTVSAAQVQTEQPAERIAPLNMRAPQEGEVTLDVSYDPVQNCYRFQLRSKVLGVLEPMFSPPLIGSNRDAKVAAFVKAMNAAARANNNYSPFATRLWLKGMGNALWDEMLPQPLKEVFWDRQSDFKRLNIVSAGDPMPWEMLYPFKEGKEDTGFLAERMTVTRWRYGTPPSLKTGSAPPLFILPGDAPRSATDEVQHLRDQIGQGQLIRELDPLLQALDSGEFGLLHFASHNVSVAGGTDSLIASYIPLNGQQFNQTFLGAGYRGKWSARSPLVFVNACCADAMAPSYTSLTGWAHCFLNAGAGAFIGSLWEVRDKSASQFAEAFYGALKADKTLGEAMKEGRDSISSNQAESSSTDPTWLAYTLYGDPDATLKSLT